MNKTIQRGAIALAIAATTTLTACGGGDSPSGGSKGTGGGSAAAEAPASSSKAASQPTAVSGVQLPVHIGQIDYHTLSIDKAYNYCAAILGSPAEVAKATGQPDGTAKPNEGEWNDAHDINTMAEGKIGRGVGVEVMNHDLTCIVDTRIGEGQAYGTKVQIQIPDAGDEPNGTVLAKITKGKLELLIMSESSSGPSAVKLDKAAGEKWLQEKSANVVE